MAAVHAPEKWSQPVVLNFFISVRPALGCGLLFFSYLPAGF